MANLIQLRRGTRAEWNARNPVLAIGEPGVETDTRRVKYGDGHLPWQDLPYGGGAASGGTSLLSVIPELADVYPAATGQAAPTIGAITTTAPAGTTVPPATAPVTVFGAVLNAAGVNIVNDPHAVHPSPTVEFDVVGNAAAATTLSVVVTNPAAVTVSARVWLDGAIQNNGNAYTLAITAGQTAYLPVTVVAARHHRIRVELQNAYFAGLRYTVGSCAVSPTVDRQPRVAVFGDSWVEGALGVAEQSLWPNVLGRLLGVPAVARMGQGGTGYIAEVPAWNAKPYTDPTRLARLATYKPDLIIVQGSQNDDTASATAVGTAAAGMYAWLAEALPDAQLVVIGPPRLNGAPPAGRLANRDALAAACAAAPNVLGFVDQIGTDPATTGWITGTGRTDAKTGDGNADVVMGSDSAHMTAEGHAFFARRAYTETLRLLGAR